jgi:hypothetical protein
MDALMGIELKALALRTAKSMLEAVLTMPTEKMRMRSFERP